MRRISHRELQQVDSGNYTDSDVIGKTGIEKYYEKQIHEKMDAEKAEINANETDHTYPEGNSSYTGNNIYLTIDSKLQSEQKRILGDENKYYRETFFKES